MAQVKDRRCERSAAPHAIDKTTGRCVVCGGPRIGWVKEQRMTLGSATVVLVQWLGGKAEWLKETDLELVPADG